jgi:hypothetical protein
MYKIVGADQREYGPVTQEEVLQWIAQGRANAQTIAMAEGGAWKPLGTFEEFKAALNISAATPPPLGGATVGGSVGGFAAVPPPGGRKTNAVAVTGLVFGILGVCCCCPYVGPIVAIICGAIGLDQIKKNPAAYATDTSLPKIAIGLGITGLVLHALLSIFSNALAAFATKLGAI